MSNRPLTGAIVETPRLILREWRGADFEPYAKLLSDPDTARFITRRGKPYSHAEAWAEMAFIVGHWRLLGYGMFVLEDRDTGAFVGRVGPLQPVGWPDLELAWALTPEARGRGYATEAATAAAAWVFRTLPTERIISLIHPNNDSSQRLATRIGGRKTTEVFAPLGEPCDVWELTRLQWVHGAGAN